jgi:hypothetical protein
VGGVGALQQADAERSGSLRLEEFDRPPRLVSYLGPSATDSFALKWNMAMAHPQGHPIVVGVAQVVKSGTAIGGGRIERIYGCGVSQTANFWRLFLDQGWHERARTVDGAPAFDAYVLVVSPAPLHRPVDAVLVNVLSESEVVGTIVQDAGDRTRRLARPAGARGRVPGRGPLHGCSPDRWFRPGAPTHRSPVLAVPPRRVREPRHLGAGRAAHAARAAHRARPDIRRRRRP